MPTQEELLAQLKPQLDAMRGSAFSLGTPDLKQESQKSNSTLIKQFLLKSILEGPMALKYPINSYNHNPAVMPSRNFLGLQSKKATNPIPLSKEGQSALFPQANLNTKQVSTIPESGSGSPPITSPGVQDIVKDLGLGINSRHSKGGTDYHYVYDPKAPVQNPLHNVPQPPGIRIRVSDPNDPHIGTVNRKSPWEIETTKGAGDATSTSRFNLAGEPLYNPAVLKDRLAYSFGKSKEKPIQGEMPPNEPPDPNQLKLLSVGAPALGTALSSPQFNINTNPQPDPQVLQMMKNKVQGKLIPDAGRFANPNMSPSNFTDGMPPEMKQLLDAIKGQHMLNMPLLNQGN